MIENDCGLKEEVSTVVPVVGRRKKAVEISVYNGTKLRDIYTQILEVQQSVAIDNGVVSKYNRKLLSMLTKTNELLELIK